MAQDSVYPLAMMHTALNLEIHKIQVSSSIADELPFCHKRLGRTDLFDYGASALMLLVDAIVVSDMSLFFILANYGIFPDVCPHM